MRHATLFIQDAIFARNRLVPVGQDRERKIAQALRIRLVRPDVVDADTQHLRLGFDELLVITPQGGELIGSTGAEVEDVEREQHVFAAAE